MYAPAADDFEYQCFCQTLRRVSRLVTKEYDKILKPLNLTAGQFTILAALSRNNSLPLGLLANALGMDYTTLSKNIRRLERDHLISSKMHKKDGRIRLLKISKKGRALLKKAEPLWEEAQKRMHFKINEKEWASVQKNLNKLVN